jgi:hypothetical protein
MAFDDESLARSRVAQRSAKKLACLRPRHGGGWLAGVTSPSKRLRQQRQCFPLLLTQHTRLSGCGADATTPSLGRVHRKMASRYYICILAQSSTDHNAAPYRQVTSGSSTALKYNIRALAARHKPSVVAHADTEESETIHTFDSIGMEDALLIRAERHRAYCATTRTRGLDGFARLRNSSLQSHSLRELCQESYSPNCFHLYS